MANIIRTLDEAQILMREVTGTLPVMRREISDPFDRPHPYQESRRWFYLELHTDTWCTYGPAGVLAVSVDESGEADASSLFILDDIREHGYGTEMLLAAGSIWPKLTWTSTGASVGFHRKLVAAGVATESSGFYRFLPACERAPLPTILRELKRKFRHICFDATDVAVLMRGNESLKAAIAKAFPEVGDDPASGKIERLRKALRNMRGLDAHYKKESNYWFFTFADEV